MIKIDRYDILFMLNKLNKQIMGYFLFLGIIHSYFCILFYIDVAITQLLVKWYVDVSLSVFNLFSGNRSCVLQSVNFG